MPGDVINFTTKESWFLEYTCEECESTSFQMIGWEEEDGTESDLVKMVCADCEHPVDGVFYWLEGDGEDD